MEVSYVPPPAVDAVWESLRPQILKALSKGQGRHYTEEFYKSNLMNGQMLMLAAADGSLVACGILSIQDRPGGLVVFVELLAGERMGDWLPAVEDFLHKYKDQIGATTIEASCRPGLVKKLTNWRPVAVVMEMK